MKRTSSQRRGRLITALLAVVLLRSAISSALSQPSIQVGVGPIAPFSFPTYDEEELFRDLWPVGFQAGLTVRLPVTEWVCVDPTLTYRIYPYDTFHQVIFTETLLLSSSGEPMQQLFAGLTLRLQTLYDTNRIAAFAEFKAGYEFERDGTVTLHWREQGRGEYTTERAPEYRHEWAFGVGIGILARLSSELSVQPAFRWNWTGTERHYAAGTVDLIYTLPL